jgi:hypothetical protein
MKVTVHLIVCDDDGHEGHYQVIGVLLTGNQLRECPHNDRWESRKSLIFNLKYGKMPSNVALGYHFIKNQ